MANADLNLPLARELAKKAVMRVEDQSKNITLADLKVENLKSIHTIAAYWDTLGWVDERMSNLEEAEQYLRASWNLTQDGVVAGHLCHLYSRLHKVGLAVQMCRMGIWRMQVSGGSQGDTIKTEIAAAQDNLDHLTGVKSKSFGEASDMVTRERMFKLTRFMPGTETAEFFLLLTSDGNGKTFKVQDVKFVSGSEKMKLQGRQIKTIAFNFPSPSENPTRFVRRGILGCYEYSGCSFVLLDPVSVTSVN